MAVEDVDGADLRVALHPQRNVRRNGDLELADPDPGVHVRLAARNLHAAEIETQTADAELVVALDVRGRSRNVRAGTDAVADVNVERGRDGRSCRERQP